MERDVEVPREIDAEILSRRGRIKVEMSLIGQGNQEVIEDKISRVRSNGMVIFDKIGPNSNAFQTARDSQVEFIQIRNNHPLEEMYSYLAPLVKKQIVAPPTNQSGIRQALANLPDRLFTVGLLPPAN